MTSANRLSLLIPLLVLCGCQRDALAPRPSSVGRPAFRTSSAPLANPAIAFVIVTNFGQTGNLWVMNADGSNQTQIASPASMPSWAKFGDGTPANPYAIAFEPSGCHLSRINVAVVNGVPQGSSVQSLSVAPSACGLYPAWSPNGDTIAFSDVGSNTPSSLWLTPANGSGLAVPIYTAPSGSIVQWSAWRSDASQIAFIEQDASNNRFIKVLNRAAPATVTTVLGPVSNFPRFIDWARTKDVLAFDAIPPFKSKCNYIYTLNLNPSGTPTQVTCGNYPTWSPDDRKLAVGGIDVIDLATLSVTKLSGGTWPDWRR